MFPVEQLLPILNVPEIDKQLGRSREGCRAKVRKLVCIQETNKISPAARERILCQKRMKLK